MDTLKSAKLQKGTSGSLVTGSDALAGKRLVGVYFSAHWCEPCREFTPTLKEFYETLLKEGCELEVVFVSVDHSPAEMCTHMNDSHGDWLVVPYGSHTARRLKAELQVYTIPSLVFLRGDGTIAERDGRGLVQSESPSRGLFDQLAGSVGG